MVTTVVTMFSSIRSRAIPVYREASRFYAKKATEKVSKRMTVQLLEDHPTLGVKGQMISVKPAFMRQQLYPNGLAAYTLNGPRIPVVEKKSVPVEEVVKESQLSTKASKKASENVGAMSLDELSGLFSTMRQSGGRKAKETSINVNSESTEITYTTSDVREYIPMNNTIVLDETVTLPVSKEYLSTYAFNISGLQIPSSAIRVVDRSNNLVPAVNEAGEYSWLINTPERKEIKVSLVVKS